MRIQQASLSDQERLYEICVLTGDSGKDATGIFQQPELLGDIWVGPYLQISLNHCFVLVDTSGVVVGYCLATHDTAEFEKEAEKNWWPTKQLRYTEPNPADKNAWTRDQKLEYFIFNPLKSPPEYLDEYPSHAHINLIAEVQGKGWGKKLMTEMEKSVRNAGSNGVHLILSAKNLAALAFYQSLGYQIIFQISDSIGVGKKL